ncbi:ABC transporter ATP-binding protein [Gammaproteobacteria bacterium]|jgi:ABC-2 type transport system ATP-binding protein|nr:ABC transporter ATP-binding protein [Gammaproteobacteria bacterium]MDB9747636.1 ABC transporter ATP-binding protein [Gammaproteobacteria bacterium]
MPIIQASNLVKSYESPDISSKYFNAVDGISLSINRGEIYGILGPNGAGKTTTLEMLEGLKDIDGGSAFIDSINVQDYPYQVKQIIGVQLQANEYFDKMTLSELLNLFSALYSLRNDPKELLKKVNLEDKANANANELSGGQKQRFSIACALVNNPLVLFLDEPTTGLDPQAKRSLWDLILDLNKMGMTIVLTTHNMEEAETLCQRIAIMDYGKIIAEDTPQNLILQYAPDKVREVVNGNMEDVFIALTGHGLRD